MSFLDEATIRTTPEKLAKVKAAAGDDDTIEVMEKKGKDMDGDGDIDSKDYLAARDAAIKKAQGKEVEEGKLSKALGGVAVLATLLGLNKANSEKLYNGDPKIKSLTSQYENAKEKGDKTAMAKFEKEIKNRKTQIDTGKMDEAKKTVKLPADTTFTLDLKHLMQKHLDEGKSQEDVVKLTKALMKKLHDKGEVKVDGTKVIFKENKTNEASIMGVPLESFADYYTALDLAKNIGVPVVAFSALLAIMGIKKATEFLKRGKEAVMAWYEQNKLREQEDAQLALPEPELEKPRRKGPPRLVTFDTDAPDYLGDDDFDYEGGMAKSQMLKMKKYAMALCDMVEDETQLEAWVQAKITKASDYMSSVYHYLDYQNSKMNEETLNEEKFTFPQANQYTLRKSKWGGKDGVGLDMPSSSKFREKDTNYILLKDTPFDNIDDLYNAFKEKLSNPKYNNDVFKRFANQTNGMILQNVKLDE